MNPEKAIWKASNVFAPNYPRQSSDGSTFQASRSSQPDLCRSLLDAGENGMPGYYSVYSFPRGHSQQGNIPDVDCIFIDLDVSDNYDPKNNKTDFGAWRRDMSALLTRVRMIANSILDAGKEDHFRPVLSGHKGLHLYLDFEVIAPNNGDFGQFKNGLKRFGEQVMDWLDSMAGGVNIDSWVDVDASDLGRLARHPNTIHHGAAYDDVTRWCVPVTITELADLRVDDYLSLTQGPRWPDDYQRIPSERAKHKVEQAIRTASSSSGKSTGGNSYYDQQSVEQYDPNDEIEIEDIPFLTANKPCIKAFQERSDAFRHGNASHEMELNVIGRFVEMGVPRDVIHEFFAEIPGYEEATTDRQIDKVIGRGYKEFNCNNIANRAATFCLGDNCSVYQRYDDIQK